MLAAQRPPRPAAPPPRHLRGGVELTPGASGADLDPADPHELDRLIAAVVGEDVGHIGVGEDLWVGVVFGGRGNPRTGLSRWCVGGGMAAQNGHSWWSLRSLTGQAESLELVEAYSGRMIPIPRAPANAASW